MSLLKNPKIIFLTPYPYDTAPGQRFRFEQYYGLLKDHGYELRVLSFLSLSAYERLYSMGYVVSNLISLLWGFAKRIFHLYILRSADFVFLFREAAPIGPPIFEWFISRVLRRKIIYDFDDAIWLTDKQNESKIEKVIRWRNKVSSICRWSHKISCGNLYLAEYARQFNSNVIVNPTTIDLNAVDLGLAKHQKKQNQKEVIIGWTGSHSTLKYLALLEPVFQQLEQSFPHLNVLVIADRNPRLNLRRVKFIQWKKETEVEDLASISIGVMPLPDDEWTKGKCGFKALQYMALEIPAVVSPIGVNKDIIDHGINGYLCHTKEEWLECLAKLITDTTLRSQMGIEGKRKVISNYSVVSNSSTFLALFS